MAIRLKPIHEQVVVITGASSGVGLATAYEFSKESASAMLAARSETVVARIAPSLGDKLAAKQACRHQYDEPPRDPVGTHRRPVDSGCVHGSGGKEKSS